jgi:hypothetical protein
MGQGYPVTVIRHVGRETPDTGMAHYGNNAGQRPKTLELVG